MMSLKNSPLTGPNDEDGKVSWYKDERILYDYGGFDWLYATFECECRTCEKS